MLMGPYAGFIVSAYGAAIAIVTALIAWIMLDHRHLRRLLAQAESRGAKRRSQRSGEHAA
jgi:heme exporter protein D